LKRLINKSGIASVIGKAYSVAGCIVARHQQALTIMY
jgi:hypothetical protein